MRVKESIIKFCDSWPGKERFGPYRFLPLFFISGVLLEFVMIHWRPNGINFYDTFKAKKAHEKALERHINFCIVSLMTSLFGSYCVYSYYQPMADFEDLVQLEFEEMLAKAKDENDEE